MNFPDVYETWTVVEDFLCRVRGSRVSYREGLQQYDQVRRPVSSADLAHCLAVDPRGLEQKKKCRKEVSFSESHQGNDFSGSADTNRSVRSKGEPRSRNRYDVCLLGAHPLRSVKKSGLSTEVVRGYRQTGIFYRNELLGEYSTIESLR